MKQKKYWILVAAVFFIFCAALCVSAEGDTIILPITVDIDRTDELNFLNYMNQIRVEKGLHPYQVDSILQQVAEERAAEICVYFSHHSPVKEKNNMAASCILERLGATGVTCWENIGAGQNYYGMYDYWKNSWGIVGFL